MLQIYGFWNVSRGIGVSRRSALLPNNTCKSFPGMRDRHMRDGVLTIWVTMDNIYQMVYIYTLKEGVVGDHRRVSQGQRSSKITFTPLSLFLSFVYCTLLYYTLLLLLSYTTVSSSLDAMSLPPFRFDIARHPTKDTIKMLASLLEKVTSANDRLHPAPAANGDPPRHGRSRSLSHASPYTCFHARSIPSISIHAYLSRILKYCPCANECFLAILVYFDRLSKTTPASRQPLRIDSYNIHRLVIAAVMVSSKLMSDIFYTNTRYAKVSIGSLIG